MPKIRFRKGYKYQLASTYSIQLAIKPSSNVLMEFITLTMDGLLVIKSGYAWDGPSGPTFDPPESMRASLVHDAGYQLMRNSYLDMIHRAYFDDLFYKILREDGMNRFRAWLWHREVERFASKAANPRSKRVVFEAP